MAQNTTVVVTDEWVQLTNADATNATIQNRGPGYALLAATTDGTAPTNDNGALLLKPEGYLSEAIADIFKGLTTPDRLWARCERGSHSEVFISHD